MKRLYRHVILIYLISLTIISCAIGPASLSGRQLQNFIQEKKIQPVAIEDVDGSLTVVLYKDAKEMGCYIAFTRNGVESFHSSNKFTNLRGDAIEPVSYTYDAILNTDIVCLTINDQAIRSKAHTIKIIFSDNKETNTLVRNNGDMIIYRSTKTDSSHIDIVIYDSNNKEIIRSPFW